MRWCVAAVVVGLLLAGLSWGKPLQQQLATELVVRASNRPIIPPQLMIYLTGKGADEGVLQSLLREQEQQLLTNLPFSQQELPRHLRDLLRQALQQTHKKEIADFKALLQQNVWEELSLFSFTHELGSNVQFALDSQYGTHTLVSSTRYGGIRGFSLISPQQSRFFDFSTVMEIDIEQDFFTLSTLPPPVFAPCHYIFHGEQYVYILNRETLALGYVGHSDTEIDDTLSYANRVHKIALVNDSLLSVRYHNANNREFVQLIDLNDFTTVDAREVKGNLLAVAPQGDRLAVQNNNYLEIIDLDSGSKQLFPARAATSVEFSADGKQLAYIDGDTLHLTASNAPLISLPQRISLAPEQTLVSTKQPISELLWDSDDLYVTHQDVLFHVNNTGEITWQQELTTELRDLQLIDTQHLAVFSEQGMSLYHKENGSLLLQLEVDEKQRLADHTFADSYLSLLLEDRLHLDTFSLTLTRIPLMQLLQLLNASPVLQKIAATEKFTLQKGTNRFAELVFSAIEQYLQHSSIPIAQLVQLLRELYHGYHLIPSSLYIAPNISNLLTQHADEVAQLTADDPAFAMLLQKSFP